MLIWKKELIAFYVSTNICHSIIALINVTIFSFHKFTIQIYIEHSSRVYLLNGWVHCSLFVWIVCCESKNYLRNRITSTLIRFVYSTDLCAVRNLQWYDTQWRLEGLNQYVWCWNHISYLGVNLFQEKTFVPKGFGCTELNFIPSQYIDSDFLFAIFFLFIDPEQFNKNSNTFNTLQ